MEISLDKVSKRFNQDWLFKDLTFRFSCPGSYAITGPNGSGKTTLMKIIAGMVPTTEGNIQFTIGNGSVDPDSYYQHLSYAAPYMELPEELSLKEFLKFHYSLKTKPDEISISGIASQSGLIKALDKPLHTFSSGMKQRVKLAISFFCACPVLMFDEPTTNLDRAGTDWYLQEIDRLKPQKLILISSNQVHEYDFCDQLIQLGSSEV